MPSSLCCCTAPMSFSTNRLFSESRETVARPHFAVLSGSNGGKPALHDSSHETCTPALLIEEDSMAKTVATILGIGFLLVGVHGFVSPEILGMHLSMAHTIVHLLTGAISVWLGLKGSLSAARTFCIVFGIVYLLLAIAGLLAGSPGTPGVAGPQDARLLKIIPGMLEFGTMDHIVHIVLGLIYFFAGILTKTGVVAPPPRTTA